MKNLITSVQPAFSSWRMKLASLALIGAAALFCLAAASGPHPDCEDGLRHAPPVEGTWQVTVSQPGETPFPSLVTFGAGGAVVATDGGHSPDGGNVYQGTWARTGPREVTFTALGFLWEAGTLANYVRIHETIKLDRSGQTYDSVVSTVEVLDLEQTTVLLSIPSTTHGVRIPAL